MTGSCPNFGLSATAPTAGEGPEQRIAWLESQHHGLVWRWLRRLGVWECDADDASQQVFLVLHRRLSEVACGSERSFLLRTAFCIAARWRRTRQRRREADGLDLNNLPAIDANPEEMLDRRRARAMLDRALGTLPMDLRTVLVLFEIEGLTMAEIATVVEIPAGTVASRLRRAREVFRENVRGMSAAEPTRHEAGGRP